MNHSRLALAAALTVALPLSATVAPPAEAQALSSSSELEALLKRYVPGVPPETVQVLAVIAALAASIALTIPIARAGGGQADAAPSAVGGSVETNTVRVGTRTRSYDAALPRGYNPARSYPVVLGFGGWQHSAAQMRGYAGLEREFDDAIVVYAQGVNDAWGGAPYAATGVDDDIAYVRAVLDDVATRYDANPRRAVAVGLSNGGGMAAALACHAPDTVRAAAAVAGAYYTPTVTGCAPGAVPVLLMHGTRDDVVGYGGGTRHGASYASVDAVAGTFGRKNGCSGTFSQSRSGNVTTFDATGCLARTTVERVEGGTHTWFTDPSATRETAHFLSRYL